MGWSKMECPGGAEIAGTHLFCGICVLIMGFLGFCNGLWDVVPCVYP
jgi:hypothetical protein